MSTRRYRTLLERMGFLDPDLGDPLHDELIFWIVSKLKLGAFEDLGITCPFGEASLYSLIDETWAFPVSKSTNPPSMIAGFFDLLVRFQSEDNRLWSVAFEAKVASPALNKLLRELSVLQAFTPLSRQIIVVCLGDVPERSIQIIRHQGYGFVKPCLDLPK